MVVTKLIGGLGNQLFQYAIGRSLAEKNNDELLLDVSGFKKYRLREFSLENLNVRLNIAPENIVKWGRKVRFPNNFICRKNPFFLYKEEGQDYDPSVLKLKGDIYLDGYWQREEYFDSIREIILQEFIPKTVSSGVRNIKDRISGIDESVSVHIRRGDYISNPAVNNFYMMYGAEYLYSAKALIEDRVRKPHYFVFSDDIQWVERNIDMGDSVTFVQGNNDYEDLYLMGSCTHNIIVNSTFSWWAAWLNRNSDKIVIAPKKWYKDESVSSYGLMPKDWIKI